jgi:WD40 repeat protein
LCVAFSQDGKLVAADASVRYSGEGSRVILFDTETGVEKRTRSGLVGNVTHISFSPDGSRIVTSDERLRVWNALTGQELLTLACPDGINTLTFTTDGHRLIAAGERQVQVFDGTPFGEGNENGRVAD